jgi:hypothetical protein
MAPPAGSSRSNLNLTRGVPEGSDSSGYGRFCCKSLFALVIKIPFGCTRDFRVKMWGASSPDNKFAGDLGNVIEATSNRRSSVEFFTAGKLAPGNFALLQQYRH